MLKIGWVTGNLGIHGSVRRVVEMANALVARGHWVTVYTVDGESSCLWLPCAARVQTLAQLHDESHDALIYCGGGSPAYDAIDSARCRVRALYILALDERNLGVIADSAAAPTRRFRETVQSPEWLVLANSTWQQEWLRDTLRPDCELLLGGVNRTIFHPEHVERDPERPAILTSGRRRAREGSGTVADAVRIVQQTMPGATYLTYAYGGYDQDTMRRLYCEAVVFADGQWYAGWNNPVIEAMACGTPVVCTDIGGVRDFAIDGQTALVVPVGDAPAMAAAILRLLADTELAQRLRSAALLQAGLFTYAQAAAHLERLIEERR